MSHAKRHRWLSWTVRAVTALLVLAVCLAVMKGLTATAPKAGQVQTAVTPPTVKVFELQPVQMQRPWRGYGTAAALERGDIPSRVMATVVTVPREIQAGKRVQANKTKIALLDASDFQRQLDQAVNRIAELDAQLKQIDVEKARLTERLNIERQEITLAQTEYRRIEGLFRNDAAKQFELDAAQRAVLASERTAVLTQEALDKIAPRKEAWQALRDGQDSVRLAAQQNVDRCTITSPIDGVLESVDVKEGESLSPGQRVARVVSLSRIEVPVQLPAAARPQVALGGRMELKATNETNHCWEATIVRLSPADDPTNRTMTVYAEVDQSKTAEQFGTVAGRSLLMPGQFVEATAWSQEKASRWIVPRRSIRAGRVLVVQEGVVYSRPVTIDHLNEGTLPETGVPDDQWAVLSDEGLPLKAGELVVLNASVSLRDGDKVTPVVARPATTATDTAALTNTTAEKRATPPSTP